MARPTTLLACCKLYISESRNDAALRAIEQAARGGGGARVAMGLAHGGGVVEVACNLLDPARVGAEQVQGMVERLAAGEGLSVGKGYFTDFSQDKIVDLYFRSAANTEG
uniref:Uncharacterized protein n=1 Tax=Oryza barthii TaxID=65489 RepID=A0A0D3GC95_9ORYZ